MKRSLVILKFLLLAGLVVFLYSFTNKRNEKRKLIKIDVEFVDENSPFITLNTVNKLLIQSYENVMSINKETLVLKEMEYRLNENPMIRDAQVFISVDGILGAKIEQRTPIARVLGSPDYYLDADGKKMPLSSVYSTRVPLINGISEEYYKPVANLILEINEDLFMKQSVIGLSISPLGTVKLKLRMQDFDLIFGEPRDIGKKFQNFKAFYKKTKKDGTLGDYSQVNLEFEGQVVATKR